MMSYGYALRLTPLKMLTFYNAVANGGKMVSPLLVKELRQYGQTLRTFGARTMVSSIASRETLEEVREAMRGVVEEGTARRMRSRYYSVGERPHGPDRHGTQRLHRPQRAAAIIWALSWAISRKTIPSTVAWSP